jgi:hypothetical protein
VDGASEKDLIKKNDTAGMLSEPKGNLKRKRVRPMATETQQHINRGALCLG